MTQVWMRRGRYRPPAAGAHRPATPRWRAVCWLPLLAVACAPALDWRQLRPDGWGLALSLPCRPASHARTLPLAGPPVELQLYACSAEDHTFAAASADLVDPARVGPALQALATAAQGNLQGRVVSERAATVPGMTPHPAARRWRIEGRRPDGQPLHGQVLVFAHGARVFQVTLLGPRADEALAKPLFDSVEVRP